MSTNVHLEFGIGLGDVDGRFCGLSATGSNLGVGLYAVPFSLRTSDTLIEALSQITTATITDNTYYTRAMSVQFSRNRTQCPPPPLVGKSKSLDLPDTVRKPGKKWPTPTLSLSARQFPTDGCVLCPPSPRRRESS